MASIHSLRERPLPPLGISRCKDWDSVKMEKHLLSSATCNVALADVPDVIDEDARRGCARSPLMATQLLRPAHNTLPGKAKTQYAWILQCLRVRTALELLCNYTAQ